MHTGQELGLSKVGQLYERKFVANAIAVILRFMAITTVERTGLEMAFRASILNLTRVTNNALVFIIDGNIIDFTDLSLFYLTLHLFIARTIVSDSEKTKQLAHGFGFGHNF